jgi:RNA 3'-terminal phosphate cyclase (ATP)
MATKSSSFVIEGSTLEGGGQVIRNATAYAALFRKEVSVTNVRGNRKPPGLKSQHLTGIQLIRDLSDGVLHGAKVGSTAFDFKPAALKGGDHLADVKTAGSICLILQAVLPCALFCPTPVTLDLRGGTNADMAPQLDYLCLVLKPTLARFGVTSFELDLLRRGFFPRGGGQVRVRVSPVKHLNPIVLDVVGEFRKVHCTAILSGTIPESVATRMCKVVSAAHKHKFGEMAFTSEILKESPEDSVGAGCSLIIVAESTTGCLIAGSAIGKKGVPAEKVAEEAVTMLHANMDHHVCVDEFLQDQLIIFMALAVSRCPRKAILFGLLPFLTCGHHSEDRQGFWQDR